MKKSFFVNFRSGEVARITVETFLEYVNNDNQSQTLTEIESTLDPCEKALAKKNSLIKVRGKRDGQMVYIIVEKIVRESLIAVINKRSEIGILEENRQLFALPGKKSLVNKNCEGGRTRDWRRQKVASGVPAPTFAL